MVVATLMEMEGRGRLGQVTAWLKACGAQGSFPRRG